MKKHCHLSKAWQFLLILAANLLFVVLLFTLKDDIVDQGLLPLVILIIGFIGAGLIGSIRYLKQQDILIEELSLAEKEKAKLSEMMDQLSEGVLIADENGIVQSLNSAAEMLFQFDKHQAVGRPVIEVLQDQALVDFWVNTENSNQQTITVDFGSTRKVLKVTCLLLEAAGEKSLLFQDLTKRHNLEAVRRDFVSNISHELRTPVAGLKAISETLLDGALDDPQAARRFVLRMDNEVDNLTQIINELLELSRIEAGRSNFELKPSEPCDLISSAVERMSLQAERMGLTLSMDCLQNLPKVNADPEQISQVFVNLIHNAIKFTPKGGQIHLDAQFDNKMVVFSVQDSGVGIAANELSRIFERFYKADRARAGGGTGLGLSICKNIVQEHGGKIWAESQEAAGSIFYFSLPAIAKFKSRPEI